MIKNYAKNMLYWLFRDLIDGSDIYYYLTYIIHNLDLDIVDTLKSSN